MIGMDFTKGCADRYPLHGLYVFTRASTHEFIAMCDHAFEPVMDMAKPDTDGWHGFLLQYHCHQPWEEPPWRMDVGAFFVLAKRCLDERVSTAMQKAIWLQVLDFLEATKAKYEKIYLEKAWGGV